MPTLMARGVSPELATRVRQYARRDPDRSTSDAIAHLIRVGLDTIEARAAGGHAVHASRSTEERSQAGRKAVTARWARRHP